MADIKIYKCLQHILHYLLQCQRYKKINVDLQEVGQGHGLQFCQLIPSIANVKIYKCPPHTSALALTVS